MVLASLLASLLAVSGCGTTKSRSVDARGMWISDSGQMAIGQVQVDAIPENVDSAIIHYAEDTAWLSPSTKTHKIDIVLTGTNSTTNASSITEAICKAFVSVAPSFATTNANALKGKTVLDTIEHNRTATQAERLAKAAVESKCEGALAASASGTCAGGTCSSASDTCPNGSCPVAADSSAAQEAK